MARLVFGMNRSLDGYVDHTKFAPGPALFRHFIEEAEGQAVSIYGRNMYEIMRYWDDDQPEWDVWKQGSECSLPHWRFGFVMKKCTLTPVTPRMLNAVVKGLLVAALFAPAISLKAQTVVVPRSVTIRVMDDVMHSALVNAQVINVATGQVKFTNSIGEVSIATNGETSVKLRVRQIGFGFVERTFSTTSPSSSRGARIVVLLHPVSYSLQPVTTHAVNKCGVASDVASGDVSAAVLAQLRLGAERYDAFRNTYPFRIWVERRTTQRDSVGNMINDPVTTAESESERWGNTYDPGHVFNASHDRSFTVPILFVSALAAPEFWTHHCFSARGVQTLDGERVVRLDFSPTKATKTPDWEGSAYLDSASSMLRRVDFTITNFRKNDVLQGMMGYTIFTSPTAFIAMPDSTVARWWYQPPRFWYGDLRPADGFQSLVVRRMVFRDSVPAGATLEVLH